MALNSIDVVGVEIRGVLRSTWQQLDGFSVCDAYIALENGIAFQLAATDDDWRGVLCPVSLDDTLVLADVNEQCKGAKVLDVVTTDFWPLIGAVLSNGLLLYMDAPSPHWYLRVTSRIGDRYSKSECRTIWPTR
ncbi:MAG: hypothetical protein O2820_24480 [Planctomycetota bacterium]|nr:hypothetical protein [Planctomycetota bacterium]MDA1252371.1 hypothetical protein [Planctomycetota bacterium]